MSPIFTCISCGRKVLLWNTGNNRTNESFESNSLDINKFSYIYCGAFKNCTSCSYICTDPSGKMVGTASGFNRILPDCLIRSSSVKCSTHKRPFLAIVHCAFSIANFHPTDAARPLFWKNNCPLFTCFGNGV